MPRLFGLNHEDRMKLSFTQFYNQKMFNTRQRNVLLHRCSFWLVEEGPEVSSHAVEAYIKHKGEHTFRFKVIF